MFQLSSLKVNDFTVVGLSIDFLGLPESQRKVLYERGIEVGDVLLSKYGSKVTLEATTSAWTHNDAEDQYVSGECSFQDTEEEHIENASLFAADLLSLTSSTFYIALAYDGTDDAPVVDMSLAKMTLDIELDNGVQIAIPVTLED
ncbi:hypothetical protein [Vibrio parahaemolyticus]|uniref:hypothetical protein n=1 Tax=Vibrio parahaemolyticus TaxID=670 RepID=UPI0023EB1D5C|nr:hypothetical protein [Vibrio parahaemolyticus]